MNLEGEVLYPIQDAIRHVAGFLVTKKQARKWVKQGLEHRWCGANLRTSREAVQRHIDKHPPLAEQVAKLKGGVA